MSNSRIAPSSRPATAFRAPPRTRCPNGELRSAATEKNFKMFKLSYETTTVRSDRPGERPIRGEVECSRSGVDRQHRQGRRAPRTQSTIAGAGIRARLHTFSCCMRGRMRHSAGPVPSPRLDPLIIIFLKKKWPLRAFLRCAPLGAPGGHCAPPWRPRHT